MSFTGEKKTAGRVPEQTISLPEGEGVVGHAPRHQHHQAILLRGRHAVTVTSTRYVSTALGPFWRELGEMGGIDIMKQWFQQDGAPPHTGLALERLRERFTSRNISWKTDVPWAPHSPDLSPLDFFLWG